MPGWKRHIPISNGQRQRNTWPTETNRSRGRHGEEVSRMKCQKLGAIYGTLSLVISGCANSSQFKASLDTGNQRWIQKRPEAYSYIYLRSCQCNGKGRYLVTSLKDSVVK